MKLHAMTDADIDQAAALVARAMNEHEGRWARRVMAFHFGCARAGLDDGREYFLAHDRGQPCGIVGLHHYAWGPETNVWLAWFAVAPWLQGRGLGSLMLARAEAGARERGYRKMLIETYDHPDFDRARAFYRSRGYRDAGSVDNYLEDGSPMRVFMKELAAPRDR